MRFRMSAVSPGYVAYWWRKRSPSAIRMKIAIFLGMITSDANISAMAGANFKIQCFLESAMNVD